MTGLVDIDKINISGIILCGQHTKGVLMYTRGYYRSFSTPELHQKLFNAINELRQAAARFSVDAGRHEQESRNKCMGNEVISHWQRHADGARELHEFALAVFFDFQLRLFMHATGLVGESDLRIEMIDALLLFDKICDNFDTIESDCYPRAVELRLAAHEEVYQQWCGPRTS